VQHPYPQRITMVVRKAVEVVEAVVEVEA